MKKDILKKISVPENVEIKIEGETIEVSGPLGKINKKISLKGNKIIRNNNELIIEKRNATKNDKKVINSIARHIQNSFVGVVNGYEYQLQICSIHFPITVTIDNQKKELKIKNFLGETKERVVKILPNVNITIDGDIIKVKSIDKEMAGQQAANIEIASKVKGRDRRIFQDGIWIIKKEKGKQEMN